MKNRGTIIIIEDDLDDQCLLEEAFKELDYSNKRMYFADGLAALDYLHTTTDPPFIIISDVSLPKLSGLELRKKLQTDAELSLRCIPYIYFTTAVNQQAVVDAYSQSAQGFFVKPSGFDDIKETLKVIVDYWRKCAPPNNVQR